MSRFVSIYQQAVRSKSLRDDIQAEELSPRVPEVVAREIVSIVAEKDTFKRLKRQDSKTAFERLQKIREQLAAGKQKE